MDGVKIMDTFWFIDDFGTIKEAADPTPPAGFKPVEYSSRPEQLKRQHCQWRIDMGEEEDVYLTSCGHSSVFVTGGIADNEYKFCPYCGGGIK